MSPFIGQIQLFAFGSAPPNWVLCDGAILPIGSYEALFYLILTKFGGDGKTNFAVPDLTNAVPLNVNDGFMCYYIATVGDYPYQY
ncbi:tail fiber protein [Anaerocolumna sp. AGMB13025]|uniref:phage tail protein n=1 Tax=Anaerocolumna sp. AGMB13025 TaxID=3039116 RepID=UPI00241D7D30|nr:tail fiber protein [Anaerocolumna sp. AGMB13025]WFR57582.1 tail fiber protein [Anaerocolumna sp. AGMB13025]